MIAAEIITALASHGSKVVIEEGRVRLLFPEDHPPPADLIDAARANKDALRAIVTNGAAASIPYGHALAKLRLGPPELIEPARWQQAMIDAEAFLNIWGAQAQVLGWTEGELFGLHPVPAHPSASYRRLSRYDATGLIWLLQGRPVIALTATEAAIRGDRGGTRTYRKLNKPALGPLGDSLDDMGPTT
jgi:hypothetical protein